MTNLFPNEEIVFESVEPIDYSALSEAEINAKYMKGEVRIITEQARYPLNTILGMVESDDYILDPEFQRRHRWNRVRKSRLIESFIMNVPIPPIFLYERSYSVYEVMDGLQRLTAISQFYKDSFSLDGLVEWPELNGCTYSSLPEQVRKGVDRRYLSSVILLQETAKSEKEAARLKQLVFERINSGGEKLTPQETRNALQPGILNSECIRLSRFPAFCKMWGIPEPDGEEFNHNEPSQKLLTNTFYQSMADVELVLRFFAFRQITLWGSTSMEDYFDTFLRIGNLFPSKTVQKLGECFTETANFVFDLLGEDAFKMWRKRAGKWVHFDRPSKLMFDPLMQTASQHLKDKERFLRNKKNFEKEWNTFQKDRLSVLSGRQGNRNEIIERIDLIGSFFSGFSAKVK